MKISYTVLAALLTAGATAIVPAAPLTPELQKKVQAATFEVVLKKSPKDPLTYEKPLPLELLPYAERTDAYWSLGTAFAIGPDTFATAAHVIDVALSGQFGSPSIRTSDGKVYPIAQVVKFALREDFAAFTVTGAPAVTPFELNTSPVVDDPIFAVGNALGEGVVIRDGLLTSQTPEQQDGAWKWLRFSAAASPGNSGGPLLDAQGRVIGIVIAKSPNENLNYASPIGLLLQGSTKAGTLDRRESFGMPPILQGTTVVEFRDSLPLPAAYERFAAGFRAALLKFYKESEAKLLASQADELFPRGASAKLLATLYESSDPTLVEQQEDRSWDAVSCSNATETPLPGEGRAWFCPAIGLFRLQYPAGSLDAKRYSDSKQFMDLLLKVAKVPRAVGAQNVRVTSLGPAQQDEQIRDRFGRIWQLRSWPLVFSDAYAQSLAMPTPDGYVGLFSIAPGLLFDAVNEQLQFAANYLYVSYNGSLPQWRAFLDRHELRPAVFDRIKLQYDFGKGLRFDSPRVQLDTSGVLTVGPQSSLELRMNYMLDQGNLAWDVGGVIVNQDRDARTYLAAYRQPKPGEGAGRDARERWEHMSKRDGDFSGTPGHDNQYKTFWLRTVAGDDQPSDATGSHPLYEVVYNTDTSVLPRQMEEIQAKLLKDLRVTE
jgi:serine protease Do